MTTAEQVAVGQLWAAWVQAAGVILGIFASLWIAVSADRRAKRAEQAAEARVYAADAAADRRARQALIDKHNALVEQVVGLVDQALEVLQEQSTHWAREMGRSNYVGAGDAPHLRGVRSAFQSLSMDGTRDAAFRRAISDAQRLLDANSRGGGQSVGKFASEWANYYAAWWSEVDATRANLTTYRKVAAA